MANPAMTNALPALVDELQTGCERSFGDAHAMTPGVYTSPEFLTLEEHAIFEREWQCVGRASDTRRSPSLVT
jgi:choline monooxygenase